MRPPRSNQPSLLLTDEENAMVFDFLGSRCQTMCTAVVQLFTTRPPAHSAWSKRITAIACFVRDSTRRSYFVRVYCLARQELYWEEQLHTWTVVEKPCDFLVSFAGENCMIGLSFASNVEAKEFHATMVETITNRQRQSQKRASANENALLNGVQGTQSSATKKAKKLRARQSDGKRKITKADISTPTNFQHIAHVGWNDSSHLDGLPQGGADGSRRIDLETQSTEERVKKIDANIGQMRTPPLPPKVAPSPRNSPRSTLNRSALPRAPGVPSIQSMPLPPVPTASPMNKRLPMSQRPSAGGAPPPPPPPPPPMADQECTSNTNQLPRSPAMNARAPVAQIDPHALLMEKIRGFRDGNGGLRKVDTGATEKCATVWKNACVSKPRDELGEVLAKRMNNLIISDSEDDESSTDSDDWVDD